MSPWLRWRQSFDRLIGVLLAVVAAPLIAVLSAAVRRGSPGPALIRLDRMGQDGRPFRMHKLRSMTADEPGGVATGARITGTDDDRITRVGRWLRATHLDELPQLVDVVTGDMSLVGPRPEVPELVDLDDSRWRAILAVRPGIGGPTQVAIAESERRALSSADPVGAYRNEVLPTKLALDAWYVEHASPRIDLEVLISLALRSVAPGVTTPIEKRLKAQGLLSGTDERAP
ncbi:MAG: sugar transferase [Acidimicrobiia bacterium]|nr:sugar transferase [Acidimicrobiia bacterium]